jgi:CRP-like cAMP-binding protein
MGTPTCSTCQTADKCPLRLSRPADQLNTPEAGLSTYRFKKREDEKMSEFARKHIFVVREGCFKMVVENGDILNVVASGELYGIESHFAELNKKIHSKPLVPEVEVCAMTVSDFETLLGQRPALQKSVLRFMARGALISRIGFHWPKKSLRERTVLTLIYLRDRFGVRYGQFKMIDVPLTKIDIASMMCTVQESAVRILSEFRKEGLISANGKRIVILDSDRLDRMGLEIADRELNRNQLRNRDGATKVSKAETGTDSVVED